MIGKPGDYWEFEGIISEGMRCQLCGHEMPLQGKAFTNREGAWVHKACADRWNENQKQERIKARGR